MTLDTVPPNRRTSALISVAQWAASAFTASGSIPSDMEVKPARSANRIVATRRSSSGPGAGGTAPGAVTA